MLETLIDYKFVHHKFKLNGYHFSKEDLERVAYSFVKEGEYYEKPVGDFLIDWFDEKDYINMYSSGTTGEPKLITIKKQAMVNSALATGAFFGLEAGQKVLHCLPARYVAGKMMFIRGFILGLELDFVEPRLAPLENNDEHYDFAAMVPLQVKNSLNQLEQIKKLIIGGTLIPKSLEKQILTKKTTSWETFGMTETITHIAAKRVGEKYFSVLPNIMLSQTDDNCLIIKAEGISDDLIITNDIVELYDENQFAWLGRKDNIVNSGGIKLIPERIEEKLSIIPRRFFITGVNDEDLGQKLILVIEGDSFELDGKTFEHLDKHEKPKEIIFIPKFKETASRKIMRSETMKAIAQ
jgi:O-succinylbenzoic acid--CoA ligase